MKLKMIALLFCLFTANKGMDYFVSKKNFNIEECQSNYDFLTKHYSNNKVFFKEIELAALTALSFYPDLKDTHIEFVQEDIKTTMETRPKVLSTFRRRSKRKYIIYVDNKTDDSFGILAESVPFNALIGLIGHELAHIADYETMNSLELSTLAYKYKTSAKFKEKFEKQTDLATIQRGLAWQLHDWANYAMHSSHACSHYKNYKKKFYLEPHEIQVHIEPQNTNEGDLTNVASKK